MAAEIPSFITEHKPVKETYQLENPKEIKKATKKNSRKGKISTAAFNQMKTASAILLTLGVGTAAVEVTNTIKNAMYDGKPAAVSHAGDSVIDQNERITPNNLERGDTVKLSPETLVGDQLYVNPGLDNEELKTVLSDPVTVDKYFNNGEVTIIGSEQPSGIEQIKDAISGQSNAEKLTQANEKGEQFLEENPEIAEKLEKAFEEHEGAKTK